jgi:hypothetical protein
MAASDAHPFPIKNAAYRHPGFGIYNASTGALITGAAGLDSEISKDGGTFTDCTNEATEIATSSGVYYLELTSTEMNADQVTVIVKSSSTDAVPVVISFAPMSIAEPAGVPTWPTNIEAGLGWLIALARNKFTQTDTTATLRNDADSGNIATATVSDSAGTSTRGEWT